MFCGDRGRVLQGKGLVPGPDAHWAAEAACPGLITAGLATGPEGWSSEVAANFGGSGSSGFEIQALQETLRLAVFKTKELEIYYNGERGLTEFVINCFAKEGKYWKNIGKYTTDFLIVKRTAKDKIHKALLIETKGALYAEDKVFQKKKNYVETEFLKLNQEKFGYQRFDFLYLEDSKNIAANITKLNNKLNQFFND